MIINVCWFFNRIDFLGYVYKVLVYIVNIFKKFIGLKEFDEECKVLDFVGSFII